MTFANNLDPDEAPQNVGLHLRSKLFDIQIIYQQKKWVETMIFFKILKETNIWKNYPACKELRRHLCMWAFVFCFQSFYIPWPRSSCDILLYIPSRAGTVFCWTGTAFIHLLFKKVILSNITFLNNYLSSIKIPSFKIIVYTVSR